MQGLGVQPGELVHVRDSAGRIDVLLEIALAIELHGATPLIEFLPPEYKRRLWNEAPLDYLAHWDRHRAKLIEQIDRILVLAGADPNLHMVSQARFHAWRQAVYRLTIAEEARSLPDLLVAIPTEAQARQLNLSLEALEAILIPALAASAQELQGEIDKVFAAVEGGRTITIHSGEGHVLCLQRGDRPWLGDGGQTNQIDWDREGVAGNLPSGAIFTTVRETETEGSLWLPEAEGATEVVFHFSRGRIERIEAGSGAEELRAMFDTHSGEPRRVSHIGLGLNPYLNRPMGWTLVDEHVYGALFVAFGENRYMGGQNESSLNIDFALPGATLEVDGRTIVLEGKIVL
ncbi:MAG: aminopeptidase [Anaerolineae bacterium]|nr:aminopeptidase [Anaerolineae bacterium]